MNYFEHHIGDYAEATGHLSILEDGAYSRMIRKYYATERALPVEIDRVQRLVGARTEDERVAVEAVLREFFELREDGWHQDRCDEAIAAYQAGAPEREVKKTNEVVRQQRHRAERATLFHALHEAGEFPAWNTPISEIRTMVKKLSRAHVTEPVTPVTEAVTSCNAPVTAPVTGPVTACNTPATATHSPVPTTQYPLPNTQPIAVAKKKRQSQLPDDFTPNEAGAAAAAGLDLGTELDAFKNYHEAKGTLMLDWQAAWRTWCGNARKFARPASAARNSTAASKHSGSDKLNYREGINHDGTFA